MIELSFVRDLVAIASFLIALTYYILNIHNQRETRKTQLFMQIYQAKSDQQGILNYFEMLEMDWNDPEDFREKYHTPEHLALVETHLSYYEGLGVLLGEKKIDANTVYKLMGRRILQVWAKFEGMINHWRAMDYGPGPDYGDYFEYLNGEMVKIRKQKGLPMYEGRLEPKPLDQK